MNTKCHIHEDADAVVKCCKCGRDICKECAVDYYGKVICTECGMPLIGFLGGMHEQPQTILEKKEK